MDTTDKIRRHIESLIVKELENRTYILERERWSLQAGDLTAEEFQDYQDDVDFEKQVLKYFTAN